MNFALNDYGSTEQMEKYSIKPYRFPAFCTLIFLLPVTLWACLIGILSLLAQQREGAFFLFGASILIFMIFRYLSILFWGTGTICIDENGFSVQELFNHQRFISWEDMPEFFLSSAGSRSFHEVVTVNTKHLLKYQIRHMSYPISNADLCDYLSRIYQRAIHTKPLENYSHYPKMSNWCNFTTITCIFLGLGIWLGSLSSFIRFFKAIVSFLI